MDDDDSQPATAVAPAQLDSKAPVRTKSLIQHLDLGLDITTSDTANYFRGKHILSTTQFRKEELKLLLDLASDMRHMVERAGSADLLKGKVMANIFYEQSTRTAFSFETAMYRLGGRVLNMTEVDKTAVKRGESLSDTVRTMTSYCDLVVLRHPEPGSVQQVARGLNTPIINAGDGTGEHPTQALMDVFTIREELGTVNNITVTFVGDLKHSRTVHSLASLLALYNVRMCYVSPVDLSIPEELHQYIAAKGVKQSHYTELSEVLPRSDVLYISRIQRENQTSDEVYKNLTEKYAVTPQTLMMAKDKMIVMHPLPRLDEVSIDVDGDPRACYFRQIEYGMYVRMALLRLVLAR
jgi:carbamoyl-phosphate synthase/aspartate carbamoyltransferase/dihydroorotase